MAILLRNGTLPEVWIPPGELRERRKPDPHGRPRYLRVDTVHQGNLDRHPGLYHINALDRVTQWQVVGCVETISERHLIPVLDTMLHQFPFRILGFHRDNGSEFLNYTVAKLLVEFAEDYRTPYEKLVSLPDWTRRRAGKGAHSPPEIHPRLPFHYPEISGSSRIGIKLRFQAHFWIGKCSLARFTFIRVHLRLSFFGLPATISNPPSLPARPRETRNH